MTFASQDILSILPYAKSYGLAILILLSLSSFSLAKNIYIRWSNYLSIITINVWVKGMIVLFGLCIIPVSSLFKEKPETELIALMLGFPIGYFYVQSEKFIARFFNRKAQSKSIVYQKNNSILGLHIKPQSLGLSSGQIKKTKLSIDKKNKDISEASILQGGLIALILLGVFEEIIYRGYLTFIIGFIPISFIRGLGLLVVAILFAFIHAPYSLPQMISKFLLSLLTLLSVLLLGTLTTAIVIHVYLNVAVYLYSKQHILIDKKFITI